MLNLTNAQYAYVSNNVQEVVSAAENTNGVLIVMAVVSAKQDNGFFGYVKAENDYLIRAGSAAGGNMNIRIENVIIPAGKNITIQSGTATIDTYIYYEVL